MRIVWTAGDMHGIGPEILLRSFLRLKDTGHRFLAAGSFRALEYYRDRLCLPVGLAMVTDSRELHDRFPEDDGTLTVLSVGEPDTVLPGTVSEQAGAIAMQALEAAAGLCRDGVCDAMVTAPLHKEAVALAGYRTTGHTDFLAGYFGCPLPVMLFVDPASSLKVALVTIHVPLKAVPELVGTIDLDGYFRFLSDALRRDFLIGSPSIAVLGLNPHASDGGVMGDEEALVIGPCIERLAKAMRIEGPFPADGFFGAKRYHAYDVVVAMYHDQGLLPFKVLAFDTGINVTLGIPVVRTSPDHGTAFDQAGKGTASERSFCEATLLALKIAANRKTRRETS
jgi:4-hydroxythreonine-4-phosphate dehydrogenase